MEIREIQAADDAQLYALIRQVLTEHRLNVPGTAYFDASLAHLSQFYAQSDKRIYYVVADENGKIYGGAGIAEFSDGTCELQKLYLLPELRRQGWGTKLIETVLAFAKHHYDRVYLESHTNLPAALKLYQNMNFQSLDGPLAGSEHSLMNVWLTKTF